MSSNIINVLSSNKVYKTLLILGNGFDLDLNLNTSYSIYSV